MLWFWQGKALAKIPYVFSELQLGNLALNRTMEIESCSNMGF